MVAIKDMEMPKNCIECTLSHFYFDVNGVIHYICKYKNIEIRGNLENKRNDFCPLILIEENRGRNERLVNKISNVAKMYPKTFSDKIYDAVTIYEGIEEVKQAGIRRGLEKAISIITEADTEGEE